VPTGRLREDLAHGQLVARLERAEPLLTDRSLVAQLDDVDPTGQGRLRELGQVAALTARVGTQIKPRRRETQSRPGEDAGWRSPRSGAISTVVHTATLAR